MVFKVVDCVNLGVALKATLVSVREKQLKKFGDDFFYLKISRPATVSFGRTTCQILSDTYTCML